MEKDNEYLEIVILILLTIITSVSYAWIEAGINKIGATAAEGKWKSLFFEPKFLNHLTIYHCLMAILVISITFGYFFVRIKWIFSQKKYWYFFISLGNCFLWIALEDNLAMFFMKEPYGPESWTNWIFGATKLWFGWFPNWIIFAYLFTLICWISAILIKIRAEKKS
jgi:hypothetical protein